MFCLALLRTVVVVGAVWRPVVRLSAAGEKGLRLGAGTRKSFFHKNITFLKTNSKSKQYQKLKQRTFSNLIPKSNQIHTNQPPPPDSKHP